MSASKGPSINYVVSVRGVKNWRFYIVKKTTKRGEGVKNRQFWDDIVRTARLFFVKCVDLGLPKMMYLEEYESTLYKWKGCVIYFGKCFGIEILQPDLFMDRSGKNECKSGARYVFSASGASMQVKWFFSPSIKVINSQISLQNR